MSSLLSLKLTNRVSHDFLFCLFSEEKIARYEECLRFYPSTKRHSPTHDVRPSVESQNSNIFEALLKESYMSFRFSFSPQKQECLRAWLILSFCASKSIGTLLHVPRCSSTHSCFLIITETETRGHLSVVSETLIIFSY
jgi:hypothetical protein